jgi:hypothetical protein
MFGTFPDDILSDFYAAYGERLDKENMDCNKPRATGPGEGSSHVVKACYKGAPEGGKIIHFGAKGVKGSPKKEGESEAYKARRASFKARHAKNIAKGPSSASWWANKVKW